MFTVALSTVTKKGTLAGPSSEEQTKQTWYICTMGEHSAKDEGSPVLCNHMKRTSPPELSEIRQHRDKPYGTWFICGS